MSVKVLSNSMASTSNENNDLLQNEELSEFESSDVEASNNRNETMDNLLKNFEAIKLDNFDEISNNVDTSSNIKNDINVERPVSAETFNIVDTSSNIKNDLNVERPVSAETSNNIGNTDQMIYKLRLAEPYNIFYNKLPEVKEIPNTITFSDLLCPSLGELNSSLQINYAIDLTWLLEQYGKHNFDKKPLTILFDSRMKKSVVNFMEKLNKKKYNIEHKEIKNGPGFHHPKIGLYYYEDMSVRVVVSSANLNSIQWNKYNQNLWISPACPKLSEDQPNSEGCGETKFKGQLLEYLQTYKLDELNKWIEIVERTDFSKIKVFLITSVPGKHKSTSTTCHVNYVQSLISKYCKISRDENWITIAQASSIGSLKPVLEKKTNSETNISFAIIYPSTSAADSNCFKSAGKQALQYNTKVHLNQEKWINNYFHEWKAERLGRSKVMSHIKSYYQINDKHSLMAFYLLTSANISLAAWGRDLDDEVYVKNHEVGVLFLPKFFNNQDKIFPLMVDLPLKPYSKNDKPFTRGN